MRERLLEIGDQIVGMFEADREAQRCAFGIPLAGRADYLTIARREYQYSFSELDRLSV